MLALLALTFLLVEADSTVGHPKLIGSDSLQANKTVACFWETYLHPTFTSENLDIDLCTHIIYGYAQLSSSQWALTHRNKTIDFDLGGFRNVSDMKSEKPSLRVSIAAGGWQTPKDYFTLVADPDKRKMFVSSSFEFLMKHGFDGFHLHWGNPTPEAANSETFKFPESREHLTLLLKELKQAFGPAGLTLSLSIWSPLADKMDRNFELEAVYKHVDLVYVQAYSYHGSWTAKTGGFAPLFPCNTCHSIAEDRYLTVDFSWRHMKKRKAIPCKTLLVVAPKGSSYLLKNSSDTRFGAPSLLNKVPPVGVGPPFSNTCTFDEESGWTEGWENGSMVAFVFKEDQWISFENRQSVKEKVLYANNEGMAGIAVDNVAMDDFLGNCYGVTLPLLREIHDHTAAGVCGASSAAEQVRFVPPFIVLMVALMFTC